MPSPSTPALPRERPASGSPMATATPASDEDEYLEDLLDTVQALTARSAKVALVAAIGAMRSNKPEGSRAGIAANEAALAALTRAQSAEESHGRGRPDLELMQMIMATQESVNTLKAALEAFKLREDDAEG